MRLPIGLPQPESIDTLLVDLAPRLVRGELATTSHGLRGSPRPSLVVEPRSRSHAKREGEVP